MPVQPSGKVVADRAGDAPDAMLLPEYLDEVVQLNLSKIPEFDMQINNLVKYNKSENFNILQKNLK